MAKKKKVLKNASGEMVINTLDLYLGIRKEFAPVTRVKESKKKYNRKKEKIFKKEED